MKEVAFTNIDSIFVTLDTFQVHTGTPERAVNRWNVSKVMKMGWMFYEAESFNQTLHAPWYE